MMGTIIGCIAGRGVGCAIGAGAGLAAGTAASAATPGPNVWIPAEALVEFHLNSPLTVTPVSAQEAARLAQGLYSGGPSLYRRGYDPYGRPYSRPSLRLSARSTTAHTNGRRLLLLALTICCGADALRSLTSCGMKAGNSETGVPALTLSLRPRPVLRSSIMTKNRVKRQLRILGRCRQQKPCRHKGLAWLRVES